MHAQFLSQEFRRESGRLEDKEEMKKMKPNENKRGVKYTEKMEQKIIIRKKRRIIRRRRFPDGEDLRIPKKIRGVNTNMG
jgi:hypothetical protein